MNFPKSGTPKAELTGAAKEDEAIFFPNWSEAMAATDWLDDVKSRRKFAVVCFLKFCRGVRRPASVTLIKGYLSDLRKQGKLVAEATEALRWWVMEARRRAAAGEAENKAALAGKGEAVRERASDRAMPSQGAGQGGSVYALLL